MCRCTASHSTRHILSDTNIYINDNPCVNFKPSNELSKTFETTQIKHIPTVFCNTKQIRFGSANIDTLVVPLSIDFHTIGYEGVGAFIQYIYAYVG